MRLTDFITRITGSLFCALILFSCDNGPDYGKMRVSRMDIVGAKAVGFIYADNNSRGEAISSGLYKIDAAGNITAVAVYFTEDESGNQSKHESEVKMGGGSMKDVGNDFIYITNCWFVDKKGDFIEELPNIILVRKSDGKMWNLDYKACGLDMPYIGSHWDERDYRQFFQSYDGTLYYASYDSYNRIENIYKFDLKTEPATIQQVTANIKLNPPYAVDSKGVIFAPVNEFENYQHQITIAWPNSGFQEFESVSTARTDYSDQVEGLVIEPDGGRSSVVCFRGQFYQLGAYSYKSNISEYPFVDLATCNKILIGDTPGSASVDVSETINLKNDILAKKGLIVSDVHSIMVTPDYILLSTDLYNENKHWILALNPEKKEWKWITETPVFISLYNSIFYNNRYWKITEQDGALGAFWFNPGSLESGFVKFNVTLPDYIDSSKYEVVDGKVIYSGVNPADSHRVKVVVDLMTGDAINNDEAPEMLFSTLISLN
ncbi:MAG: hypothetical protein HDT08_01445 [Bacteroidales bacterium]|nr:hypothetical protein [Bacteroidales bacterium]